MLIILTSLVSTDKIHKDFCSKANYFRYIPDKKRKQQQKITAWDEVLLLLNCF